MKTIDYIYLTIIYAKTKHLSYKVGAAQAQQAFISIRLQVSVQINEDLLYNKK